MKAIALTAILASLALLPACTRQEAPPAESVADAAGRAPGSVPAADSAQSSAAAAQAAAKEVVVEANDMMKFSVTRIEAQPGQTIRIVLKNVGKLPKEAMGHNLVLLTKTANPQAYATAATTAKESDYTPPSLASEVIAATRLLGPGEQDTITFQAPAESGEYTYLCSFPGHFFAGMKGILVVQ